MTTVARRTGTALATPTSVGDLGQLLAQSGYFTDARQAAQAAVKVMAGAELGFPPIASMTGVYIVKGRVTLSAQLMAAAIKRSDRYDYRLLEHTDKVCRIAFRDGDEVIYESSYSMDDAKAAGLAGSDTWKKHPRNMLFARALSNGAKWACPDIFGGPVYTPDELGAVVDGESGDVMSLPAGESDPQPSYQPLPVDEVPGDIPNDIDEGSCTPEQYQAILELFAQAQRNGLRFDEWLKHLDVIGARKSDVIGERVKGLPVSVADELRGWLEAYGQEKAA